MPLYELACENDSCGDRLEALMSLREYETGVRPHCPACGGPMQRIYLPSHVCAVHCDPIVLHRSTDGTTYRYPGRTDAPVPEGFVKLELQPAEARRELQRINRIERSKMADMTEAESAYIHHMEETNRRELRSAMERMTPAQRAFAQHAIAYNNARRPVTRDANVTCDVLELDASNRPAWDDRDRSGRSRR